MAVAAALKFVQGATVGTAGQALFGVTGTSVQASNGAASPGPVSTWTFTVISVPSGSAIPLGVAQTGSTPTWSFTPDVVGCYLILITVTDSFGNVASDARCFGVKTASGRLIPCFKGDYNSLNFTGQATGWDVYMESWLQALESLIDAGATPPSIIRLTAPGVIVPGGIEQAVNLDYTGGGFIQPLPATSVSADGQVLAFQDLSAGGVFTWPSTSAGISVAGGAKVQRPDTLALITGNLLWSAIGYLPGNGLRIRLSKTENVWTLA
jgi:hypothetical protein